MNLYGFATGTNDYSLNLSERDSLRVGDIVTVAFLNGNTGASTLSVNGNAPLPLLRNESAMSSGDLVALTLYQFCFTGAAFKQDVQASAGATTDASLLTSGTLAEARLPNNINATRVADGSISNTEFQYLNNVSSNIQGQLDALTTAISGEASTRAAADSGLTSSIAGKADTSHTHSGTDIVTGTVPVAAIPTAIPAASIANGTVDNTEFQTLNGVTSNIQNQLDNKAALSHSHAASDITSGTIATARLGSGTADSTTFLCGDQTYKTISATNNFAGTYCGINSSQTITASTLTDVLWDEIISETANLSHTTGAAPFTSNLTQYYDIDIVVVPQSSNTSGYTNGAYLALVVDGATVAKQPHSLYNDTGSNWVNPIFVINATVQVASTKDFKVQFYPGGYNVDLLGKDSAAYRCTIRVRERGV